jgi:hypothetical protein
MNIYQVVVLICVVTMIAAMAFVRGADARAKRRLDEIRRSKKSIRWPAHH